MNDHERALELFCQEMYRFGSPVLFVKVVKDTECEVRIGSNYGSAKALKLLIEEKHEWLENFLKRLSSKPNYLELVQALDREPTIADIRFAFRPHKDMLRAVFVDDVRPKYMDQYGHVWVETSQNNWQVHFMLDERITTEEALEVQRLLRTKLVSDAGSVAGIQARRFPVPGLRAYVNDERPPYSAAQLIEQAEAAKPEPAEQKYRQDKLVRSIWSSEKADKYWKIYIREVNGDCSTADMKLAHRMLSDGVVPEDIKELLLMVSEDIESRKSGHVEDYLERTLQAAMNYHQ